MRSMGNPADRSELLARIRALRPDSPRRWGTMTAPRMVAHLTDQMGHTLGDHPCTPVRSFMNFPPIAWLAIYVIPWPKGRAKGPADAFVTQPGDWNDDIRRLEALVARFAERDPAGPWPPHALFGRMSGRDWGVFCYKHFNHHLTQFGV